MVKTKVEICYILVVHENLKTDTNIYYNYHIIFVCKYRKKIAGFKSRYRRYKTVSYEICQRHKVIIRYMETDKDHIHYMVETEPTMSVSKIVNLMKSYTITNYVWERYPNYLRNHFGKNILLTDGYFSCSVGNIRRNAKKIYRKSG